jgi:hypothetical protein
LRNKGTILREFPAKFSEFVYLGFGHGRSHGRSCGDRRDSGNGKNSRVSLSKGGDKVLSRSESFPKVDKLSFKVRGRWSI